MKILRALAVVVFAALLLLMMGFAPGAALPALDPSKPSAPAGSPVVTVEKRGEVEPGKSLSDVFGPPKGGTVSRSISLGVWVLNANTAITFIPGFSGFIIPEGETLDLNGYTFTILGDMTISGTLLVNGGKLFADNLIIDNGLLVMKSTADYVQVKKSFIANGRTPTVQDNVGTEYLTAGKIKIGEDFLQLNDYSPYSYKTSGSHITEFNTGSRLIQFESPGDSAIRNPVFASGTSFTTDDRDIAVILTYVDAGTRSQNEIYHTVGGTYLSISKTLTANYSINAPKLCYTGAQGNWGLTVTNGSLIVPPGITQSFTGNVVARDIYVSGTMNLAVAGKTIEATEFFSVSGTLNQTAGAVTTKRFESAAGSLLATGDSGAVLTINKHTDAEVAFTAPCINLSGSLAGRRLSTQGSLTVLAGHTLDVGSGRLDVAGDMTVSGLLEMNAPADTVVVGGTFTTLGGSSGGLLTDGYLALMGGLTQQGDPSSFKATENHKTLLCGSGAQAIDFANTESTFANLYVLNAGIDQAQADGYPCTGARVMTGTLLSGIGVEGGGSLDLEPGFTATTLAYEAVVPRGAGSATVTFTPAFGNQTVQLSVGGVAQADGVVAVPAASHAIAMLSVLSAAGQPYDGAGAPFTTTYTLTLEPVNTELASPGMAYAMDGPFTAAVEEYAVTVPVKDGSFTFAPETANPNATFRFVCGGVETAGPSFTRGIELNESILVDVIVSSYVNAKVPTPDTKTYHFTFHRQTLLDGIGLSTGTLNEPFAYGTADYTVDIPAAAWSVVVTPGKGGGCDTLTINGTSADSFDLRPAAGCNATATLVLSDASGTFTRTYTVTVRRAPLLSGILVSSTRGLVTTAAALRPAFSSQTNVYIAYVPVNYSTVVVTGVKEPGCTALTVGGQADTCELAMTAGAQQTVVLEASAGDAAGQKAVYTVNIVKALLMNIVPSVGALNAPFDPSAAVASSITVPYTSASVTITPLGNDYGTKLVKFKYYEKGRVITSTTPSRFTLSQGQTRYIVVRASYTAGGITIYRDYSVRLYREKSNNANLKSLGVRYGLLSPAFNAATTNYTLMLPETISSVRFRPVLADRNSKYSINGQRANTSKLVRLALNGTYTVKIVVTALRGNTKTYVVTVIRKPMVASSSVTPLYLGYPALSPGGTDRLTFNYSLNMRCTVKIEVKKAGRYYLLLSRAEYSAGAKSFAWDGKVRGVYLASGTYSVRITPYWAGRRGTRRYVTIRILSKPAVTIAPATPLSFTPDGTSSLAVDFKWTQFSDVKVEVVDSTGAFVKLLYSAQNQVPATSTASWDGTDSLGNLVPAGTYRIKVTCGGAAPVYTTVTVVR